MIFDVPLDQHPPAPGDVLYPGWPTGRAWYRVCSVRPVESRQWANRWDLTVDRVAPDTPPDRGRVAVSYEVGGLHDLAAPR